MERAGGADDLVGGAGERGGRAWTGRGQVEEPLLIIPAVFSFLRVEANAHHTTLGGSETLNFDVWTV